MKMPMWMMGIALAAGLTACGRSGTDASEIKAVQSALQGHRTRFEKMRDALPKLGAEQEKPCKEVIPAQDLANPNPGGGFATVSSAMLTYWLGSSEDTPSNDRNRLTKGFGNDLRDPFNPRPDAEVSTGATMNLKNAAKGLDELRHVVVLRPNEVDKGELNGTTIVRPALWKGWAFVFTYGNDPTLLGAFPVKGTNSDNFTTGNGPHGDLLLDEAAFHLRDKVVARLGKPGCVAE